MILSLLVCYLARVFAPGPKNFRYIQTCSIFYLFEYGNDGTGDSSAITLGPVYGPNEQARKIETIINIFFISIICYAPSYLVKVVAV